MLLFKCSERGWQSSSSFLVNTFLFLSFFAVDSMGMPGLRTPLTHDNEPCVAENLKVILIFLRQKRLSEFMPLELVFGRRLELNPLSGSIGSMMPLVHWSLRRMHTDPFRINEQKQIVFLHISAG